MRICTPEEVQSIPWGWGGAIGAMGPFSQVALGAGVACSPASPDSWQAERPEQASSYISEAF